MFFSFLEFVIHSLHFYDYISLEHKQTIVSIREHESDDLALKEILSILHHVMWWRSPKVDCHFDCHLEVYCRFDCRAGAIGLIPIY